MVNRVHKKRHKLSSRCVSLLSCLALFSAARGPAQADPLDAGGGAIFRLDPPSAYEYGCYPPCLCPILHVDGVQGTMKLIHDGHDGLADLYHVADVNWRFPGPGGMVHVVGEGRYSFGSPDPIGLLQHRLELGLSIGGESEEHFDSGWVPVKQFGGINISISMNEMYCFDTVFILHASRVPDDQIVPYALKPGSTFQRGCWNPCDCPIGPELPMIGTFGLVPMSNVVSELEFAVVNINLSVLSDNVTDTIPIKGYGKYRNEPDIERQQMGLTLVVGDEPRTHYDSGDTVAGAPFPWLDVVVSINGLVCFDTAIHIIADPVNADVCGGIAGIPCGKGELCKLPLGACCCDHLGLCVQIPPVCPLVFDPVCGCDGVTYNHECEADLAGVTIRHLGVCQQFCGGWFGDTCREGEFCKYPLGVCNDAVDNSGVCTPISNACPEIYDPVCGCDGVTYDNECFADASSVSVLHHGPCQPVGACCLDVDDGPIAYDTCHSLTQEECHEQAGLFGAANSACETTESCCFSFGSAEFCADLHLFCCLASGGIPQGLGSSCYPLPEFCGGIASIPCPDGYECADNPNDNCDPDVGGADCPGICVPDQPFCGGIANIPCPVGFVCVDDPTDNCDPNGGGADCSGVCIPEPPCGETCGGIAGIPCTDPDEFCKLPVGACCCDHIGLCAPLPEACPDVWDPVCGCDGNTYGNECEADAVGVSILHPDPCNVCRVSPDGSTCEPFACSPIPENRCLPGVIHLDINTGALTVDECDCLDFNLCHIEFGDASPFAVGVCPNGGTCEVIATDTDNDGTPDMFRAECRRVGACCSDMGGSPLPVPVCVDNVPDNQCSDGLFKGHDTTCESQACCLSTPAGDLKVCLDLDPVCCARFGGEPRGPSTSCDGSTGTTVSCPQVCGGFSGIPCDDPNEFCKTNPGECCCDFFGVCTPIPVGCIETVIAPVCGCDGVTYVNECYARAAGVSIDNYGECNVPCSSDADCPSADQFCQFPIGSCGATGGASGQCTPLPPVCPENYDPVCGCDDVTYTNECHADMAGVSILHDGPCDTPPCAATRRFASLDPIFCPGDLLHVVIELNPPAGATALALEDLPPAGWSVTQISNGGFYDPSTAKVKWGPFFAPFPNAVWYEVVPAANDLTTTRCFSGIVSVDGENQEICGDTCVTRCCPKMEADLPRPFCPGCPIQDCTQCDAGMCANGRITLCDVIGYACGWFHGCHDNISGVTRAAFIWRNGECYCWDDGLDNWFPNDCTAPNTSCCGGPTPLGLTAPSKEGNAGRARMTAPDRANARDLRPLDRTLSVDVSPPTGASAFSVEVVIPAGWRIATISDGGFLDEVNRKVKWGPLYGDGVRTLTFEARPEISRSTKLDGSARLTKSRSFSGTVSFDGINRPLTVE